MRVRYDRLQKLADFLRKQVPRQKFNFGHYMYIGENEPAVAFQMKEHSCGTTGCAIGWLPVMAPRSFEWSNFVSASWGAGDPRVTKEASVLLKGSSKTNTDAAAEYFGISELEAEYLFIPEGRILGWDENGDYVEKKHNVRAGARPETVARHIEKFIAQKKAGKFKVFE